MGGGAKGGGDKRNATDRQAHRDMAGILQSQKDVRFWNDSFCITIGVRRRKIIIISLLTVVCLQEQDICWVILFTPACGRTRINSKYSRTGGNVLAFDTKA